MATAYWHTWDGKTEDAVIRTVRVPRRASSLRHWLKEVTKAIPSLPPFETATASSVTEDEIRVSWNTIGYLRVDRTTRGAI